MFRKMVFRQVIVDRDMLVLTMSRIENLVHYVYTPFLWERKGCFDDHFPKCYLGI